MLKLGFSIHLEGDLLVYLEHECEDWGLNIA
jgi:hypothetical protein